MIKNLLFLVVAVISFTLPLSAQNNRPPANTTMTAAPTTEPGTLDKIDFSQYFKDKTMRVDFYHSGGSYEDRFSVDQIVSDGIWPGSKKMLIDHLGLGPYFLEVYDLQTNRMIYSRGFASIFGEWQTTPEAEKVWGTFNESIRFPWPLKPIRIEIQKRNLDNRFRNVWILEVDPASRQVNTADLKSSHIVDVIQVSGPAETKVDLVILGDGYTKMEMEKFKKDAKRLTAALLEQEPFKSHKTDLNIRAVETPGTESGVFKPHPGVFKRTPLSVHYGSFDSERYALTYDNRTVRDVAAEVPYDFMVILVNERTYGGGGIYNLYTTVSVDNKFAEYIMVHELGHHMAGLADEYYTSSVAYEKPVVIREPWETNITALLDRNNLKWQEMVDPSTPIPTKWNKEEFDNFGYNIQRERDSLRAAKVPENVMEALFMRQYDKENAFFLIEPYKNAVGAFEGAGYSQYGLYRPQLDCIMYTRHMKFCKVCQKSLIDVMNQYNQ